MAEMAIFEFRQGERLRPLEMPFRYVKSKTAPDLTGLTGELRFAVRGSTCLWENPIEILTPEDGEIDYPWYGRYYWGEGETDECGDFLCEVKFTDPTAPDEPGYTTLFLVRIVPGIADPEA